MGLVAAILDSAAPDASYLLLYSLVLHLPGMREDIGSDIAFISLVALTYLGYVILIGFSSFKYRIPSVSQCTISVNIYSTYFLVSTVCQNWNKHLICGFKYLLIYVF